jgi:hypothetical protein
MGLARAHWLLAVCGACGFDHGVGGSDAAPGSDSSQPPGDAAIIDAPAVPADARTCFGTFKSICFTTLPQNEIDVSSASTVSTANGCPIVVAQTTGPSLCVIAARNITISASVQASGPRPLVFLATETLTITGAGLVDVGSYKLVAGQNVNEVIGAGASTGSTLCGGGAVGGADNSQTAPGGGGGAGGSFGGAGGAGARGVNGTGGTAGSAGTAAGTPSFLRGGCRGSSGGSGNGNPAGFGGAGGGAVLLIAGTSIDNAGHIRAGGMGGYGGGIASGGGGGGSGGMIVLDAPSITNTGILNANGAGGGEGGGGTGAGDGGSSALAGTAAADGGSVNANGGDGGRGSWQTALGGTVGGTGNNGGGGGGGGAGAIRIVPAQSVIGTVSPDPS